MKIFTRPGWRDDLRALLTGGPAPAPSAEDAAVQLAATRTLARVFVLPEDGDRAADRAESRWRAEHPDLAALVDQVVPGG